jgi:hypothetical protein
LTAVFHLLDFLQEFRINIDSFLETSTHSVLVD